MKMKKTFSLKLMLLGLLIGFGSIATYAANFFVNGAFVYKKVTGGVQIVGCTGIPNTGILTIESKVVDTADPNKPEYDVVSIADNWYNAGVLIWRQDGTDQEVSQPTANLLNGGKFKLVIDANKLGAISTKALQPLSQYEKLTGFQVTDKAALVAIPDFAFARANTAKTKKVCPDTSVEPFKGYQEKLDLILATEDAQIEDYTVPVIENGKFNGKQVYKRVYPVGGDWTNFYVILGDVEEGAFDSDNNACNKLIKINEDGTTTENTGINGWLHAPNTNILKWNGGSLDVIAEPVAADFTWGSKPVKGLKTLAQEATNKYNTLKELLNNLKLTKEWTDLVDAQKKAANALSKWTVYSQKVNAVRDLWNVPYIVTNAVAKGTTEGTFDDGLGNNRTLTAAEKTAVTNIITAMREQEFTNITEIIPNAGAEQMKSDCSNYPLYWLSGDYKTLFGQYLPEGVKEVTFQDSKLGYVGKDETGNCKFVPIEMGYKKGDVIPFTGTVSEDGTKLTITAGTLVYNLNVTSGTYDGLVVEGKTLSGTYYNNTEATSQYYYLDANGNVYLYEDGVSDPAYGYKPYTWTPTSDEGKYIGGLTENTANKTLVLGDGTVVAVAAYAAGNYTENALPNAFRKPSFETVQSYLAEAQLAKEAADKAVTDFIAYTDEEDKDADGNPKTYNMAQFEEYVNGPLLTAKNNADKALEDATNGQAIADQKETLEGLLACWYEDELNFNDLLVNRELTTIDIEAAPSITAIGKYAAAKCEKAELVGTSAKLPANLTTIGERAFYDAKLANPDFTTLTKLWRIGDYAFAQSGATDGDFHDAANLGIEDPDPTKAGYFGTNVFDDCAIVNLMLKGTPLKAIPGNLAQGLKRVEAPFMDACGKFWNFDNDKNKLTDHALTADEIAVLKPYLWKDKTATELEALVGTKLNDEQVSIITTAGLVMETKRPVNISLIEASLPVAITVIEAVTEPNPVVANKVYGTYENCINLATLTGGIPAGVTTIGYKAFYATKIDEFNLSALDKLSTIGKYAFGGNSELTKVTLPEASAWNEEGLTELPEGVFECDSELEELILNPELTCLPKGLLKDSKIEKLDLSNTQIEVLPDLFEATSDDPNTTLVEVILPEEKIAADGVTVEIPGLKVIMDNAFANMHALKGKKQEDGSYRFEIPSTVWIMRPGVFFNDIALEEVYAMDSRLTNLGVNTFKGCASLKKFTFVTLETINSTWTMYPRVRYKNIPCEEMIRFNAAQFNFDDMQFFGCPYGDPQTEGKDKRPIVVMTQESYDQIKAEYWNHPAYDKLYSRIEIYQPTIELTKIGGKYYGTYYNANYGTWVPMSEGKVYTAYQDGGTIYAYSAKHNNGYYKIPAAGESTFIYDTEARYAQGSAAVLIVSDHKDVKVERHSTMYKKNHSTLDIENELRVTANNGRTGYPIATTTADFIYKFSFDAEGPGFFHWVTKPDNKVVPVGKVVFPMSDYQGTANPNVFGGLTGGEIHAPVEPYPARLNIVFVDDETSTGIKDYIKSHNLNDGAIYNLQGVRVKNTVKGQMYIQNGQKFIQK
jgi:hypothetical protein